MELFMAGGNYAASEVRFPGFRIPCTRRSRQRGKDCGRPLAGQRRVNYTVGNRALAERNVNKFRVVQNPTHAPATNPSIARRRPVESHMLPQRLVRASQPEKHDDCAVYAQDVLVIETPDLFAHLALCDSGGFVDHET